MQLLPALDLRGGQVVRLRQGDDRQRTVYDHSPADVLRRYAAAGVVRAHVVDLDAALGEEPQRELLADLARLDDVPELQLGGGLRDRGAVEWALGAGYVRAVITSLMVRDFDLFRELCQRHPGRLVPALDTDRGELKSGGWRETADVELDELCDRLRQLPIGAVLVTDISRDGMMAGPNLDLACDLGKRSGAAAILSGGVSSLEDLERAACRPEISAAVVGKALYDGRVDLVEALRVCDGSSSAPSEATLEFG